MHRYYPLGSIFTRLLVFVEDLASGVYNCFKLNVRILNYVIEPIIPIIPFARVPTYMDPADHQETIILTTTSTAPPSAFYSNAPPPPTYSGKFNFFNELVTVLMFACAILFETQLYLSNKL